MKKEYVLPICFAAAAHGALLFGVPKNSRPVTANKTETTLTPFELVQREDPPVEVESERSESKAKSAPDLPQPPRSEEPLVLEFTTRQTMNLPPLPRVNMSTATNIIPAEIGVGTGDGKKPWGNIIGVDLLDNEPRTRLQSSPMYPHEARREGLSGEVLVEFLVDEQGRVVEPRVVKSSHRVFEEATLRAVAKWKFEPGRRDGRIVRFRMSAPVVFNLND